MNGWAPSLVQGMPVPPRRISQRAVPRPGNRSNVIVLATAVRGERGKATPARLIDDIEDTKARLEAYIADRRARGVRPEGILFEGEEDL